MSQNVKLWGFFFSILSSLMKNKYLHFFFQINAVKSFAQTLRRYTGLNHLAQVRYIKLEITVDEFKKNYIYGFSFPGGPSSFTKS